METNETNKRVLTDNDIEEQKPTSEAANALVGGHVAPSEEGTDERTRTQARRAEKPEADAKDASKKDNPSGSASSDIINNTGDDADMPEADAATG